MTAPEKRGFAALPPERRREIAASGGRAAFALAMACARKSGGDDITASACHMLEVVEFDEEKAIAAIRNAGAKWREQQAWRRSVTS